MFANDETNKNYFLKYTNSSFISIFFFLKQTTQSKMDRKPKQTFLQRGHIVGQQAHEKILNIAVIWEVQIKTTMMYHIFTLVRMAIIKTSTNNERWRRGGEKGTLLHCCWECKLVQPLWRLLWRFLKKVKIELPYNLAILLLDIYPENTKINLKRCMHASVHSSTV